MLRDLGEGGGNAAARDKVVIHGGICGPTTITSAEGVTIVPDHAGRFRFFVEMHTPYEGEMAVEVLGLYRSHDEALEVAGGFLRQGNCDFEDRVQAFE